jgi:allophanate hydrolase subunit 1
MESWNEIDKRCTPNVLLAIGIVVFGGEAAAVSNLNAAGGYGRIGFHAKGET